MSELLEIVVHEVSTPDKPANRRKFLIVKSQDKAKHRAEIVKTISETPVVDAVQLALIAHKQKDEHDAPTFDDTMLQQQFGVIMEELSKRYGSLLQTVDGILSSDEGSKPDLILEAVKAFTTSVTEVMPSLVEGLTKATGDHPLVRALREVRRALTPEDKMSMTAEQIQKAIHALPDDVQNVVAGLRKKADAVVSEKDIEKRIDVAVTKAVADAKPKPKQTPEQILKSMDAGPREMLIKAQADAKDATEKAERAVAATAVETALRVKGEHAKDARDAFKALPGKFEETEALLLVVDKLDAADRDVVRKAFASASTALIEAGILKEAGRRGDPVQSEEIQTLAEARAAKDNITVAKAMTLIADEKPEMYQKHLDAQRARARGVA
jgi:hypothetical protein